MIKYAASKNPQFVADLVLKDTKAHWAAPFRKDEAALRGEVQDVLNCMKKDGTVAKLSEKWFGEKPAPDDLENVTPGLRRSRHAGLRAERARSGLQQVQAAVIQGADDAGQRLFVARSARMHLAPLPLAPLR